MAPQPVVIGPGVVLANKYQVIERIGAGGMGAVYRAREIDFHVNRSVAIKVLTPQFAGDARLAQRFAEEIQISTQLDHPNIVPIYFVGREGENLFFVMKYLRGQTLKALVAGHGPLPPRFVVHLMQQLARAIDSIHRQGAIHRDIKSVNIMIDDDGNATLMDFGIAKMEGGADLTTSGEVLGTAPYMAPEQWRGEKDPRSDLYALGIVMYETLTGDPPFVSNQLPEMMDAHLNRQPVPLRFIRPEVPAALVEVVDRCLAKAPADRYPTANDLAQALDFADRGFPPNVPAVLPPKPPVTAPPTDPLAAALAAADRLVGDGSPHEARQAVADAVGHTEASAEVILRLDELAKLAAQDDEAKTRAQKLLDKRNPTEAEQVILNHLREYPASRIGNLLASIYQTPSGIRAALQTPASGPRVGGDAPTIITKSEKRWLKPLLIAGIIVVVLGILIGGPFVFSGATSNVLERLGDQFNAEQWYASPPVLNATACYRLALSFNPSNRTALHAMQDMATHLWSTARAYRERGDLKSAVQYLGWAVEITRNPDWERTYWQYQRQLKK